MEAKKFTQKVNIFHFNHLFPFQLFDVKGTRGIEVNLDSKQFQVLMNTF